MTRIWSSLVSTQKVFVWTLLWSLLLFWHEVILWGSRVSVPLMIHETKLVMLLLPKVTCRCFSLPLFPSPRNAVGGRVSPSQRTGPAGGCRWAVVWERVFAWVVKSRVLRGDAPPGLSVEFQAGWQVSVSAWGEGESREKGTEGIEPGAPGSRKKPGRQAGMPGSRVAVGYSSSGN